MTTPAFQHDEDLIHARYGRVRRANPRSLRILAIALSAIALGLMVWIGLGLTKAQASSQIISFNVVDSGLTTLHFEVTKPAEDTAECVLEALSTGFAQVGVKTVTIGPAETDTVTLFEEIKTSELATTAVIDHCTLVD